MIILILSEDLSRYQSFSSYSFWVLKYFESSQIVYEKKSNCNMYQCMHINIFNYHINKFLLLNYKEKTKIIFLCLQLRKHKTHNFSYVLFKYSIISISDF